MAKQLQLFQLISFNKLKNEYYIDLGRDKFATIKVDENDAIISVKGLGYQAAVIRNHANTGKSFCEEWQSRTLHHKINNQGSSNLLPVVVKAKQTISFKQDLRSVTHKDLAISNWIKQGWSITYTKDPNIIFISSTY